MNLSNSPNLHPTFLTITLLTLTCCTLAINPLNLLPNRVRFYTYPKGSDPTTRTELHLPLKNTTHLLNHPGAWTILLIHDANSDPSVFELTKDAYLHHHPHSKLTTPPNIILIDWRHLAGNTNKKPSLIPLPSLPTLPTLAKKVIWTELKKLLSIELASRSIISLLKSLEASRQLRYKKVHLIGHGAGGCGLVARVAKSVLNDGVSVILDEKTKKKKKNIIGRITGLDPSSNKKFSFTHKIKPDLAKFVDVVFTSASGGSRGHANFYVNGAASSAPPGCENKLHLSAKVRNECAKLYPIALFNDAFKRRYFGCPCSNSNSLDGTSFLEDQKKSKNPFKKPPCNLSYEKGRRVKCFFIGRSVFPGFRNLGFWTRRRGDFYLKAKSACDLFPEEWRKGVLQCGLV